MQIQAPYIAKRDGLSCSSCRLRLASWFRLTGDGFRLCRHSGQGQLAQLALASSYQRLILEIAGFLVLASSLAICVAVQESVTL